MPDNLLRRTFRHTCAKWHLSWLPNSLSRVQPSQHTFFHDGAHVAHVAIPGTPVWRSLLVRHQFFDHPYKVKATSNIVTGSSIFFPGAYMMTLALKEYRSHASSRRSRLTPPLPVPLLTLLRIHISDGLDFLPADIHRHASSEIRRLPT